MVWDSFVKDLSGRPRRPVAEKRDHQQPLQVLGGFPHLRNNPGMREKRARGRVFPSGRCLFCGKYEPAPSAGNPSNLTGGKKTITSLAAQRRAAKSIWGKCLAETVRRDLLEPKSEKKETHGRSGTPSGPVCKRPQPAEGPLEQWGWSRGKKKADPLLFKPRP